MGPNGPPHIWQVSRLHEPANCNIHHFLHTLKKMVHCAFLLFSCFIIVNPFPIPLICPFTRPFVFLANILPLLNPKCLFSTGQYFLVVEDYREDVAELVCMFVGDGVEHFEQGHHHHLALRVLDQTLHQT